MLCCGPLKIAKWCEHLVLLVMDIGRILSIFNVIWVCDLSM